jgi:hypothetical protein
MKIIKSLSSQYPLLDTKAKALIGSGCSPLLRAKDERVNHDARLRSWAIRFNAG